MDEMDLPDERQPANAPQPVDDPPPADQDVEEASEDSFPASDPPSFTGTTTD